MDNLFADRPRGRHWIGTVWRYGHCRRFARQTTSRLFLPTCWKSLWICHGHWAASLLPSESRCPMPHGHESSPQLLRLVILVLLCLIFLVVRKNLDSILAEHIAEATPYRCRSHKVPVIPVSMPGRCTKGRPHLARRLCGTTGTVIWDTSSPSQCETQDGGESSERGRRLTASRS